MSREIGQGMGSGQVNIEPRTPAKVDPPPFWDHCCGWLVNRAVRWHSSPVVVTCLIEPLPECRKEEIKGVDFATSIWLPVPSCIQLSATERHSDFLYACRQCHLVKFLKEEAPDHGNVWRASVRRGKSYLFWAVIRFINSLYIVQDSQLSDNYWGCMIQVLMKNSLSDGSLSEFAKSSSLKISNIYSTVQ